MKYRHPNGSFAGAVVIESTAFVIARMQATVFGLNNGLDFMSGCEVGAARTEQIPTSMIDRLLDERDLYQLHPILLARKPHQPWAQRGAATRRANSDKLGPMCGRFAQGYRLQEIQGLYDLTGAARHLQPHYNLALTDPIDVVGSPPTGPPT